MAVGFQKRVKVEAPCIIFIQDGWKEPRLAADLGKNIPVRGTAGVEEQFGKHQNLPEGSFKHQPLGFFRFRMSID